jgi:hypothetical protein
MDMLGCGLLLSGWGLTLAALILLSGVGQRCTFVIASIVVEALGLAILCRAWMTLHRESSEEDTDRR